MCVARQATIVRVVAHRVEDLGRQYQPLAGGHPEEVAADHLLIATERVPVGHVEEVDAEVERAPQDGNRVASHRAPSPSRRSCPATWCRGTAATPRGPSARSGCNPRDAPQSYQPGDLIAFLKTVVLWPIHSCAFFSFRKRSIAPARPECRWSPPPSACGAACAPRRSDRGLPTARRRRSWRASRRAPGGPGVCPGVNLRITVPSPNTSWSPTNTCLRAWASAE